MQFINKCALITLTDKNVIKPKVWYVPRETQLIVEGLGFIPMGRHKVMCETMFMMELHDTSDTCHLFDGLIPPIPPHKVAEWEKRTDFMTVIPRDGHRFVWTQFPNMIEYAKFIERVD